MNVSAGRSVPPNRDQPGSFCRIAESVYAACLWEATAEKPGNVHPRAAFEDLTYLDFAESARIFADSYRHIPPPASLSQRLLAVAENVAQTVGKNTNLGILLLIIPLAEVPIEDPLEAGIVRVIDALDVADTARFYQAIRRMQPGGMGEASEQDLADTPTLPVRAVMSLAAERDLIARQYSNHFADVLGFGRDRLLAWRERCPADAKTMIIGLFLDWLARFPDSLIQRKLGEEIAAEASQRAAAVLSNGWPEQAGSVRTLRDFDDWLRADGHRRNPGTTADLTAATLFVGFREGLLPLPRRTPEGIYVIF